MTEPVAAAAAWMAEQVKLNRELHQIDAVADVERLFGKTCVRENDAGNPAFSPAVLAAFRKLTGDCVVWEARERYWRLRMPGDEAGRRQP